MDKDPAIIRTTVYMTRELHFKAKQMALLANCNLSTLIRVALNQKIKEMKENAAINKDK